MGVCQTLARLDEMQVKVADLKEQFDKIKTNLDELDKKRNEIETNFKSTQDNIKSTVDRFSGGLSKPIDDIKSSSKMLMDTMKGSSEIPKKSFF